MNNYKKDFDIFKSHPNLVYLDSAASALKVKHAILAMDRYYHELGVNVHRGAYNLSYEATKLYEDARQNIADFIHAKNDEVIFTKGTTQALNLVAHGYENILTQGDEIIVSELEHHSSLLPWIMVSKKTGAKLVYVKLTEEGRITVDAFKKVLTNKTRIVALTLISNVLGYETPIKEITMLAHKKNAHVIVDAAQAAPHKALDVKELDCDYLAFSGHKLYGPTGVGVLYGKKVLLDQLEPFEYGGEMVDEVFVDHATFKSSPLRFEAGTPVIAEAIGLSSAIDYLKQTGYQKLHEHTEALKNYTLSQLTGEPGIIIYNQTSDAPIITLNIDGVHPHDIASFLDQDHICVRAGHHCAQLVSKFLGVSSTLRLSFNIYNTMSDCDQVINSLKKARDFFKG